MQVVALGHAHAVLGADRAVVLLHGLEHPLIDRRALGEELVLGQALRLENVQMQVAVADMAEPHHFEVRVVFLNDAVDIVEERRHLADSHRDVVLVRRPVADGFRDVLAQLPQVLQLLLALAHHAIQYPALLDAVLEGFQGLVGHFLGGRLELQQGIERAVGLKSRRHIAARQHLGQGFVGEELEGGQVQLVLEGMQHRHDRIEVRGTEHHGSKVLRRPLQTHGRLDNKAQGAFGADE